MKRNTFRLTLLASLVALLLSSARADTAAPFSVDWRGLPNVEGILRDNSKAKYGFVNFVAFGPGWKYTAQDYAAYAHLKSAIEDKKFGKGLLFTGKIKAGDRELAIREEFYDLSDNADAKTHVKWTISSTDGKPMDLERAYIRFPLSRTEFAGGTAGGKTLPETYGEEWLSVGERDKIRIVSKDGTMTLLASVQAGNPVLQDARKDKVDRFEFRIDFPDAKTAQRSTIEFDVAGRFADSLKRKPGKVNLAIPPPPLKMAANADWCVFPFANDIKAGSILDFSSAVPRHKTAGEFGFARVTKDGHFAFEKSDNPMRFVGGNLCFDANFLSKEQCKAAVNDFVRRGWNAIRFHHIDVLITKDGWNNLWGRKTYPEISPSRLDQLDYLLAECKKAGIYVTFDLYAMGCLGSCAGFDKPLNSNTIKAIVPIHKPAEDQWFKRAMEIFDHVNPYTGVAWKDEPAILFVTLLNEDSINSVWWGAAEMYVKKYNVWAPMKGYPKFEQKGIGGHREFAEFLFDVKAKANKRMSERLRAAGVKTLISGGNWWDTMQQAYEREALDVIDNHGYGDHPQPNYQKLPFHVNNKSDVKSTNPTYNEPIMKAPTRILGKPFTITEYNYCVPNQYRADGGVMMGAYAALQDWDALYRFAWSHSNANMFKQTRIHGFDIVTDPIGQLTERQIVLLFGRGDVKRAEKTYAYGVTRQEAFAGGLGDMWAKGLFPHAFTHLAYTSRIGSFVADKSKESPLAAEKTWSLKTRKEIPAFDGSTMSDTKEISINTKKGDIAVSSVRSAAVCSIEKANLTAGPLSVSDVTTFCSVSASAMDGKALVESKRILLLHITDVRNTGMEFSNANANDTRKWGELPYLAKTGSAKIVLKNANANLKVYALASDGTRIREIPAKYVNGAYHFTVKVAPGEGKNAPTMMYECS